jgi:hypothetical protein
MARNHVPQFANLPAYAGPGIPTRARNVVKSLTELPERFIEYVDDNVAASKDTLQDSGSKLLTHQTYRPVHASKACIPMEPLIGPGQRRFRQNKRMEAR